MEKVAGVNEQNLDKFVLEIQEYAEKVNRISNELRDLIYDSKSYFISENGDSFRKECESSLDEFYTINQNFLKYAQKLVRVKSSYNSYGDDVDVILTRNDV